VGQSDGRTAGPLILRWSGKKWSRMPVPAVKGGTLRAVAGASVSDAWTVGYSTPTDTTSKPLILHWNGKHWTRAKIPAFGHSAILNRVAALSSGDVWAVGFTASVQPFGKKTACRDRYLEHQRLDSRRFQGGAIKTLILHWNGTSWQ
jgi:hypothetical protein